jgi:hypothetical protein
MIFNISRKKTALFIFWVVFFSSIYLLNKPQANIRLDFQVALHNAGDNDRTGAFYYDTGKGFNEKQSVKVSYYQETDGTFYPYSVGFPVANIQQLRFDPLFGEGSVSLKDLTITKYNSKRIDFSLTRDSIKPLHSIQELIILSDELKIVSNGEDPHIMLSKNPAGFSIADVPYLVSYTEMDKVMAGILALVLLSFFLTKYV